MSVSQAHFIGIYEAHRGRLTQTIGISINLAIGNGDLFGLSVRRKTTSAVCCLQRVHLESMETAVISTSLAPRKYAA